MRVNYKAEKKAELPTIYPLGGITLSAGGLIEKK